MVPAERIELPTFGLQMRVSLSLQSRPVPLDWLSPSKSPPPAPVMSARTISCEAVGCQFGCQETNKS